MSRSCRRVGRHGAGRGPWAPALGAVLIAAAPSCARADDLFVGVYRHDAELVTHGIGEGGADLQLGYRFDPLFHVGALGGPAPYLLGSLNSRGDTSFAAAGLAWRFGGPVYLRPGLGVAVHTGPSYRVGADDRRTDLGSRVLFEPELALGLRVLPRVGVEASWTHLSHAQIFGRQNPGVDMVGARITLTLP